MTTPPAPQSSLVALSDPQSAAAEAFRSLRTNIQLPNFDEFHETFGVQEGDGMWRAKEDRVIIW